MRVLSRLNKRKSALSNIVAYVLLISMSLSLSVLVYGWLKFYVDEDDIEECPSGVNIVIKSYECFGSVSNLTVTLKNRGLFTVDGYILRVHDREDAAFGFYALDDVGTSIVPGAEHTETYNFSNYTFDGYTLSNVTLVDVRPFMLDEDKISCESYASQRVDC